MECCRYEPRKVPENVNEFKATKFEIKQRWGSGIITLENKYATYILGATYNQYLILDELKIISLKDIYETFLISNQKDATLFRITSLDQISKSNAKVTFENDFSCYSNEIEKEQVNKIGLMQSYTLEEMLEILKLK